MQELVYEVEKEVGDEIDVVSILVRYSFFGRHIPAIWNVSPEEFPELEIDSITVDGRDYTPTKDELEEIEGRCMDSYSEPEPDYDD